MNEPLPDIDWSDVCDTPDGDRHEPEPGHRDLIRCGLTAVQLHTMTTIELTGSYL